MLRKSREKGFWLIELLTVIVIIAVMAAISIPRFTNVVRNTRNSEAKMILKQIYKLEEAYYPEYGNYTNLTNTKLGYEDPGADFWSIGLSLDSDSLGYTLTATESQDTNGDGDVDDTWSLRIVRPDSIHLRLTYADN